MDENRSYTPKITVIIPMYNCENFVFDLLFNFSTQSFTDFEVICVIDGATDNTENAVKKYCEKDNRFSYIFRENGGAGAARNTGMDLAKGKYIIFPDADDLYSKDYLLKLYEIAESNNAEIAVCGAETFDHIINEIREVNTGFNKSVLSEGVIYSGKRTKRILNNIDVQVSNKIILMDFIKKNNLRFSETKASNDLFFVKATIALADRIVVVNDNLITIRRYINPESISSNRGKYSYIALKELQKLYQWMEERDLLKYFIFDYLHMFDVTVNYEMKNSVNPVFAKDFVQIINCEAPWRKLNGGQLMHVLETSFGDKGAEIIKVPEVDANDEEKVKTEIRNEKVKIRNKNRKSMQELIKKESLDIFGRDLDDPESVSSDQVAFRESLYSDSKNSDRQNNTTANPEVTVVIPMYNCADYVNEVLPMFAKQSFTDFEVICVVDGATDNTEELVADFCKKDQRFFYMSQENKGPGSARNAGLDLARGKYIVFSDADDEYHVDYLKKMYETALRHDAQIVISRFIEINNLTKTDCIKGFDEKKYCENIPFSHFEIEDLFMSFGSRITNVLCNMVFLKKNGIRFPDLRISEDSFFLHAGLSVADRVLVLHDVLLKYYYCRNDDSVTNKVGYYQHEAVYVLRLLYQWLKRHSLLDIHLEDYLRRANDVIIKYRGYNANLKFINEFAHMLNAEEPWQNMTSGEILDCLGEGLLANNAERNLYRLSCLDSKKIETDKRLDHLLNILRNAIHTSELLRCVSKDRYGRDFSNPERPFISEKEKKKECNDIIHKDNNKTDHIPVVFVCDDGYAIPTVTAITSLICSKENDTKYYITIIAVDMNDDNVRILKTLNKQDIIIQIVKARKDKFLNLSKILFNDVGVTASALGKFFIPKIVSAEDKAIYLDGDIIVQRDLSKLYGENINDYCAGVIRDMPQVLFKKQIFGISHGKEYFNSGVMLLNIKKMNEENITEKLIEKKKTLITKLMDQDVFNEVLKNKRKQLSIAYNVPYVALIHRVRKYALDQINDLYDKSYESIDDIRKDGYIIHYCTVFKPWKYYDAPMADEWLKYFYKSPLGAKIIVRKSVRNRNKVHVEQNGLIELRDSYENKIAVVFVFSDFNADEITKNIELLINDQDHEKIKYAFFILYNNRFFAPDILIRIRNAYKDVQLINVSYMLKNNSYYFNYHFPDNNYMKLLVPEILTDYRKSVVLDGPVKKSFRTCLDNFEDSYDYGYVANQEGILKSSMIFMNCKNFILNDIKHKYIKAFNEKSNLRTFDCNNSMCFLEFD